MAQEAFLRALIERQAQERGVLVSVRVLAARGGSPRALAEFKAFQRVLEKSTAGQVPDLVVVARDTDCRSSADTKQELVEHIDVSVWRAFAAACPDPCVEAWYLLDRQALRSVVGAVPTRRPRQCHCLDHKSALAEAMRTGGGTPTLGGAEVAPELVEAMNLYRCGRAAADFRHFLDDLDDCLARVAGGHSPNHP